MGEFILIKSWRQILNNQSKSEKQLPSEDGLQLRKSYVLKHANNA